ncbi:MAG: prepilin peptidase [Planctomycetota bacterium]
MTPRRLVIAVGLLAAAAYMILIPSVDALLQSFGEQPTSYVVEDLSVFEVLRIRSAKLAVFAIFAYAGACVGSFLNVVAASAPKGESIVLRSSACPHCQTPIRRIDNLPIFGYLILGGRCRDCQAVISIRYLMVELTGLAIFGSLFLFELVTGAANVPESQNYLYTGIVWIILYTKWPVVGLYAFHCLLLCSLLLLALMEIDELRAPRWLIMVLVIFFAGLAWAIPGLLPVSMDHQTPLQWPDALPDWTRQIASSVVGGVTGLLLGQVLSRVRIPAHQSSSLLTAMLLIGFALGWQASTTIAVFWFVVVTAMRLTRPVRISTRWLTSTTLLFVITWLHQPAWNWLATNLALPGP